MDQCDFDNIQTIIILESMRHKMYEKNKFQNRPQ